MGALAEVEARVQKITGVTPHNHIDLYRYAQYIVLREAGPVSHHVERLQGLSLLCRNLFVSGFFFFVCSYVAFRIWTLGVWKNLLFLISVGVTSAFLIKGALDYSVAAKYGVYRGVLVTDTR